MSETVLDASALLALLDSEPGADRVHAAVASALISTVNLAEVYSNLADRGSDALLALQAIRFAVREVVPFTDAMAELTGRLRPLTRDLGLSLGDRACLALAMMRNADVVTADKAWRKLKLPCTIHIIR
ncbi:MAG TPA: type II toxin-antitoxin system VapC family toxin [Acidobacteriaceae bacterium]